MHDTDRYEVRGVLLDISFSRNGILYIRYDAGAIHRTAKHGPDNRIHAPVRHSAWHN